MNSRFAGSSAAAIALVLTCTSAYAQSDAASLSGTVTDPSGAVVPNAKVTVTDTATKDSHVVTTNGTGNFTVPNLRPSGYDIRIEASGFQTTTLNSVKLDPSIGRHVDATLKIGDSGETVTVEAGANTLQTESAVVGQLVTQEQVKSIQLNGRNPLYLSQLEPGVTRNASMASFSFGLDNGVNIGGSRSNESIITLDGAPMVRTRSNGTSVGVADVDSTSQVQILTNSYDAEYGRTAGGQIRMVPKSGTSQFHGSVYEYFRNTALNANTWQRKLPTNDISIQSKPQAFRYNQYGFNLNGPVYIPKVFNTSKSKLFFLFGQEYIKYVQDDTVFNKVPTNLMRAGNFSELLQPNIFYGCTDAKGNPLTANCQNTQIVNPNTKLPYANNVISPGDLSANGLALLAAYPVANASGSNYNWVDAAAHTEDQRKDTLVVDYVPADAHRIRLSILNYNYHELSPHYGNFNRTPQQWNRPNQIGVLHYTWTISPTLVNEATVSAAADHVTIGIDQSSGLYDRTRYGINYPYLYSAATKTIPNKIPTIQIGNSANPNFTLLDGGPYPSRSGGIVYTFGDNLTKIWGNHAVKFGFVAEYSGENNFDQITVSNTPGSTNNQNGKFVFTDTRTGGTTSGVGAANAALGLFDTYGEIGQRSYTLYRAWMYEGFAQDTWRATSKLVIEAGLRYSLYNPYYAKWGNQSVFSQKDYNPGIAATVNPVSGVVTGSQQSLFNGVVIPGSGFPSSAAGHVAADILTNGYGFLFRGYSSQYSPTVKTNIQPRVGITYQVHPGMVVRAGGGRYVQRLGITDNVFTGGNAPFQPSSTVSLGQVNNPGGVGQNNFPLNYSSQAFNYPSPEAYNWNFTVEQELKDLGILTLAYAGRRGLHLEELVNVNQLPIGTDAMGSPAAIAKINPDSLRPFKGFSNISQATNGSASMYHSFQANLRRRLTKGLLFGVAYTYAKSMDFGSSNGYNLPNALDRNSNWGPSDFDLRHVFVANFVYNINQFDHASNFLERGVLSSWEFSGTLQAQTGQPLSVVTGDDIAGVGPGSGNQFYTITRPVQTTKSFAGQSGTSTWFDTGAFAAPAPGTFTPRGVRNVVRGPGFQSYNAALSKTFHIYESHAIVFRGEAFNLLNHPTADAPDTNPTSGTFGRSTTKGGTYDAARQFQFSLRYGF